MELIGETNFFKVAHRDFLNSSRVKSHNIFPYDTYSRYMTVRIKTKKYFQSFEPAYLLVDVVVI